MSRKPIFLTIAGIDPCGGAGIIADLRVAQSLGCFGMAAATALTAQDTTGVHEVWASTHEQILGQAMAVINDANPDAIKVGMLGNADAARAVCQALDASQSRNIVVDTIMTSTSGMALFDSPDRFWFLEVMKRARIITPNLPEAFTLLGDDKLQTESAVRKLSSLCAGASVYLKGGHADFKAGHAEGTVVVDTFYNAETDHIITLTQPRLTTQNTHGTGCTLSSALASYLALGHDLDEAARLANAFMHRALVNSRDYRLGAGSGPAFVE